MKYRLAYMLMDQALALGVFMLAGSDLGSKATVQDQTRQVAANSGLETDLF